MNFNKNIVVLASVLGALTIMIGAFGAHSLKELVDTKTLAVFETGVRYQMYHVLALLILGVATVIPSVTQKWVSLFFILGIIFFSGSIYVLSLNTILTFNTKMVGIMTPIGGLFFILGWLRLSYGVYKL